jgi:hypothetical protein
VKALTPAVLVEARVLIVFGVVVWLLLLLLVVSGRFHVFSFVSVMDRPKHGTMRQMRVFVQVDSGEKHLVGCFEDDTIWQLKQRIFELTDVMPDAQQLFIVGKKDAKALKNTKLVSKSKVKNGAQLAMREHLPESFESVPLPSSTGPAPQPSTRGEIVSPRKSKRKKLFLSFRCSYSNIF